MKDMLAGIYKSDMIKNEPEEAHLKVLPDVDQKSNIAKWKSLSKVNVLLETRQKDFLDDFAKKIMRNRKCGGERITANTILRCLVDVLESKSERVSLSEIGEESQLVSRLIDIL
jgi:hypothetical protein